MLDATFADIPHAELMARLAELGIPAGEVRTLDRVYDWEQTRSRRASSSRSTTRCWAPSRSPGRRSGFDDNAYAGGRSEHLHPPLLGEHNDSVRAWLDELDERGDPARARRAERSTPATGVAHPGARRGPCSRRGARRRARSPRGTRRRSP